MDYEKAYKELVKDFNTVLNLDSIKQNGAVPVEDIVKMIPELKETEDNSIKEELINFLNTYINAHGCTEMSKWVSWIEKQEKKNNLLNFDEAEKEKNDFVSGQFIECRKSFNEFKELESYWLEYVGDDTYIGRSDNVLNQKFHITPRQLFTLFTHEHCKKYYENQAEQKAPIDIDKMVADYKNNPEKNNESFGKPVNCMIRAYRQGLKDAIGKIAFNPAEWNEEDESWFKEIELMALSFSNDDSYRKKFFDWFKSLKERVQPQLKQKWSEDDEKKIMWLVRLISTGGFRELDSDKMPCSRSELLDWLKSIKPQPKQEWSEEDERIRKYIIWHLGHTRTYPDNSINSHVEEAIAWLENQSIKNMEKDIEPKFMVGDTIRLKNSEAEYTITNIHDRCYYGKGWSLDIEKTDASDDWELVNSKQSCWKPTNEQMIAFRLLLDYNIGVFDYKNYMTVQSLYEDLQKNTEK